MVADEWLQTERGATDGCRFSDLLEVPLRNGLTRPTAVRGSGIKMVNMGELFAHPRIGDVEMERVPLSGTEAERYLLEPGDLLFARQSLVLAGAGKCSVFLGSPEPVTFEGHLIRARINKQRGNPLYFYYYFRSPQGRAAIESIVEQVAAAGIRGSDLARLMIPCPSVTEQDAIAAILGSLDDKIELNRRMNQTLEAMARAVFKSWFVDFDPVRVQMEGRQPVGMDAETAGLFPDALEDSPLGEIPRGWRAVGLLDCADLISGGTPSTAVPEYWDGGVPWVSAKDVTAARDDFILATERTISRLGLDNSNTKLAPAYTTVITARGTVGTCCLLGQQMTINQTNYGLSAKPGVGAYFVFFTLRGAVDLLRQHSYGTIFDTVTTRTLRDLSVVLPAWGILDAFHRAVSPMMERWLANLVESKTLAALRDALLPKLLSGEIRVGEAEAIVAGHV